MKKMHLIFTIVILISSPCLLVAQVQPSRESTYLWIDNFLKSGQALRVGRYDDYRNHSWAYDNCVLSIRTENDGDRIDYKLDFRKIGPANLSLSGVSSIEFVNSTGLYKNGSLSTDIGLVVVNKEMAGRGKKAFERLATLCNKNLMDDTF